MNDLERIKHIETKLRFKLNKVSLENLFTENSFLATSDFWIYSLFDRLDPKFYYKGVRNFSLDENGNVIGLALDFCGLFVLEDNYLANFEHLEKLKLKSSRLSDYKFFLKLKNLTSLDLSNNNLSNVEFLKDLTGLTSLDLRNTKLSNVEFLKDLTGLTSLSLRNNNLSNVEFLKDLTGLTSLDLSYNNLSNVEFLKDLTGLTSLDLSYNNLSNVEFLKDLTGLTSLSLSYNNLSNVEFLKDLTGLTSLDLSNNNLSNVEFLKDLTGLTSLDLSSTNLSNVEFLKDLTGLTSLDLSNNNLSNVEFLKDLTGLTSLDLSSTNLSNVEFLKDLTGLTSLSLSNNKLSNVEFLKDLTGLTSLSLSYNKLSNVEFLKDLTGLTSLDLSNTKLSNVEFLKDLTGLTSLSLSYNKLSNVEFLKDLTGLTSLSLRNTNLSNVEFLKDLTGLTSLYLSSNNLSNVEFLKDLTGLTSLDLSNTNLSNVEFLKDLTGLTSLDLRNNTSLPFAEEVLEDWQNAPKILDFIRDYYAGKEKGTNLPLNEGKIILIGQGNVGKTSLRKRLIEGIYDENQPKTEGLEVVTWDLSQLTDLNYDLSKIDVEKFKDVKLNVWDFGGQEIYHTTHQFFFNSRCLYILVADFDEREEWKTNRIEYWLKTIEFLIKDENTEFSNDTDKQSTKRKTPVIVIGNKADKNKQKIPPIDKAKLEEKYQELEIVGFIPISCSNDENIEKVIETITEQLQRIGVFKQIPEKYAEAREKIQKDQRPFISQTEFGEFCSPEDVEQIRSILNDIGTIKAFSEDKKIKSQKLKNLIVLQRNWITEGIYKILSANYLLDPKEGIATKPEIRNLLDKKVYPNIDNVLEMMEEFYICRQRQTEDSNGNRIDECIFPSFFSIQRPQGLVSLMREPSENKIEVVYEYPLLSDNVISFFIIEASKTNFDTKQFWREGAFLANEHTDDKALIEADSEENQIKITIKANTKELSERCCDDIKKIFDEVHKKEFIPNPTNKTRSGETVEDIKKETSTEQFNFLDRQLKETKGKLEDKDKELTTIFSKLKKFIDELSKYRARPKSNIFAHIVSIGLTLLLFLSFYYGWGIVSYFGVILLVLQLFISNLGLEEWTLQKAPEQIVEAEKKKIIIELGFNAEQQELLK